jgi:hypothetical protein
MNIFRKLAVATLAVIMTLAGTALIVSPFFLAQPAQTPAHHRFARLTALSSPAPGRRSASV